MIKKPKTYIKVFRVTNKDGNFTEEDFNLFKEKLEIIRKLYYDENVGYDYYHNFRVIIREIKRAAYNAGLTAELISVEYDSKYVSKTTINPMTYIWISNETGFSYNLIVSFKRVKLYENQKDFVIRNIKGHGTEINVKGKEFIMYSIPDSEISKDIIYTWRE